MAGIGKVAKGRGRTSWLPDGTVAAVMRRHQLERPRPTARRTGRPVRWPRYIGVGKDSVARIWGNHELKPWRVEDLQALE